MASGNSGQPVVVVTGRGIITSLGAGKADNWAKLTAGQSGIRRITRFANVGLKTTIAGTVDFVPVEPFCSTELGERMAASRPAGSGVRRQRRGGIRRSLARERLGPVPRHSRTLPVRLGRRAS